MRRWSSVGPDDAKLLPMSCGCGWCVVPRVGWVQLRGHRRPPEFPHLAGVRRHRRWCPQLLRPQGRASQHAEAHLPGSWHIMAPSHRPVVSRFHRSREVSCSDGACRAASAGRGGPRGGVGPLSRGCVPARAADGGAPPSSGHGAKKAAVATVGTVAVAVVRPIMRVQSR